MKDNLKVANAYAEKQKERQKAIANCELFTILPHLKKPIKYLLKR